MPSEVSGSRFDGPVGAGAVPGSGDAFSAGAGSSDGAGSSTGTVFASDATGSNDVDSNSADSDSAGSDSADSDSAGSDSESSEGAGSGHGPLDTGGLFGGPDLLAGGGLFPSVPSAGDVDVAPDKVADAARIIEAQAEALDRKLSEQLGALQITPPAEDIVSKHAVEAWNDVVSGPEDSYAAHARTYASDLRSLATQLRKAGETYSESDEEKADGLRGGHGLPG